MNNIVTDQIENIKYTEDTHIDLQTKEFLKVINSGGVTLETTYKEDARQVLIGAQASIKVDLSGIEVSPKNYQFLHSYMVVAGY